MKQYWSVPAEWPDATVVCIAGGPSLTVAQVEACRDRRDANGYRVRVIAVNDAYRIAPWADVLYFCDDKWWTWHAKKLTAWPGRIVRLQGGQHDFGDPRIKVLKNLDERRGLSSDPSGLHTGQNSGYQAINLAVLFGAKRVLLLGYDMHAPLVGGLPKTHWFGDHPGGTSPNVYDIMRPHFESLPLVLEKRGITVVNCTPGSALKCFARSTIDKELP